MENQSEKFIGEVKKHILPFGVFVASLALNLVSYFLLPEKIYVQLMSEAPVPETKTILFLVASVLIVGLSAVMAVFGENRKKWLALETIIAIAQAACIIYNYLMM